VNKELHRRGITANQLLSITVEHEAHVPAMKKRLKEGVNRLTFVPSEIRDWWLRTTTVRTGGRKTGRLWQDAQTKIRKAGTEELFGFSQGEIDSFEKGENLHRIPGSTRIPVLRSEEEWTQQYRGQLLEWARHAKVPTRNRWKFAGALKPGDFSDPYYSSVAAREEYTFFREEFQERGADRDRVFSLEDKSPTETWSIKFRQYCYYAVLSAVRTGWEYLPGVTPEMAEKSNRSYIEKLVPPRFNYLRKKVRQWGKTLTPYAYVSLKLKCFDPLVGLVCKKRGHQHYRKILSFKNLWGRRLAKRIHVH